MKKVLLSLFILFIHYPIYGQGSYSPVNIEKGFVLVSITGSFDSYNTGKNAKSDESEGKYRDYYIPSVSIDIGLLDWLQVGMDISYKSTTGGIYEEFANKNKTLNLKGAVRGFDELSFRGLISGIDEGEFTPSVCIEETFFISGTGNSPYRIDNPGIYSNLKLEKSISNNALINSYIEVAWDGYYEYPVFSLNLCPAIDVSDNVCIYAEYTGTYTNKYEPDNLIDAGVYTDFSESFGADLHLGTGLHNKGKRFFGGISLFFSFDVF